MFLKGNPPSVFHSSKSKRFDCCNSSGMAGTAINEDRKRAHFTFIWAIKKDSKGVILKSPIFSVQSMEMTKWNLVVCAYVDGGVISCGVERAGEDDGPKSIEIEYELSFLDINGSPSIKKLGMGHFQKYTCSDWFAFPETCLNFKQRNDNIYPKFSLTVCCRMWRTRTEISKSELCFATTRFDVHKHSCFWAVKEFSSLKHGEKRIRILNSSSEGCPEIILNLHLTKRTGQEYILVEMEVPGVKNYLYAEAKIALLDADGMVFLSKASLGLLINSSKSFELAAFDKNTVMSQKGVLLSDDVLLLRCELRLASCSPSCSIIDGYKLMHYPQLKLADTEKSEMSLEEAIGTAACPFKETVNRFKGDGTLSDVCLRAGNKSFPVHKLILSCRSPVFKAMFTKDMREKTSNCIDIPDVDADTLNRLLLYIYEDKLQDLTPETAANLFQAADKYELLDLKAKCSRFLTFNISESNACDILVLADLHHDENMKRLVHEFIRNNSDIIHADVWKAFRDSHPKLALVTTEEIIYNMKFTRS